MKPSVRGAAALALSWVVAGSAGVVGASAGLAGCQRGEAPAAGLPEDYAGDVARLCDVVARSGADQVPASERAVPIAQWLGANLKTAASREFLVRIQPLDGEAKARALDDEARRVGLSGCALSAEWRK